MSREDCKAFQIMNESVKFRDGHYEIDLPWKKYPTELPNNKALAEHRLQLLKRRFSKNSELFKAYADVINDYLSNGYAEKVPNDELNRVDGMLWYLPHHPVFHPEKPGKTRVVFDCSAKYREISLNDCLFQGPDLNNTLIGVLSRFRQERIALMSDIESMFHQVRVTPDHCDSLRFLWWQNNDVNTQPQEFRMKVHLFGGISSPSCSAFALRKTAKDNEKNFSSVSIETVENNFYVDDCLKSTEDESSAIALVKELCELLLKGGFRLHKWLSNSSKVTESIPESERASSMKNLELGSKPIERALGVNWNLESDMFGFNVKVKERPFTRRGILSVVTSVFDPFGFAGPFLLPAKILLQDLCRLQLKWDDVIPESYQVMWSKWLEELPILAEFTVDRCIKPKDVEISSCQLHHFCDASQNGYGAVSYIRFEDSNGGFHCAFLIAKSRVVPLKPTTIPRLELTAATVAIRLDLMRRKELELPIHISVFWTDSTSVLKYIRNEDKRFQTFVANRISFIREHSEPSQWRYVESKLNPADHASRGLSANSFLSTKCWLNGPDFLWDSECNWPKAPLCSYELEISDPEVKRETTSCVAVSQETNNCDIEMLFERFSSWMNVKRFVAWILRYKNNMLRRIRGISNHHTTSKENKVIEPISVEEMTTAEMCIIKYIQKKHFAEEISSLSIPPMSKVKKNSSLFKLNPILMDGVIRVGGRLQRASLPVDVKHQIILPKGHHVTKLIILHYHSLSGHSGREYVLSLLRGRFWVINANIMVRKLLSKCLDCRKRQGSVCEQKMANLPVDRLSYGQPPFSRVGIDFFGPFMVKQGRCQVKRYGCIFTCLLIRAVHLEVAFSLETDSFINCLQRFIARRGKPELIRSDNGSNFIGGEKEIRHCIQQWNLKKIHDCLLQQEIKWIFNPPNASHHGGVWERCIRTTRKILNALLKEQILTDESLQTLLCEVEAILNGRPISRVSEDPSDLEALTPNHLLLLRSGPSLPPGIFIKEDLYSRRRWRQVQYMADQFWTRWIREYLPLLQRRSKWNMVHRNVSVGDIVLLVDSNYPRNRWPLAKVIQVIKDEEGYVRQLRVKTKTTELERPINKCVLLLSIEED